MVNASLDDIGAEALLLQADYIRAGPSAPPVSCDQNGWYHFEKAIIGIVRKISPAPQGTKADLAAQKKRLQESLDKLAGKSNPQSIQQSISIKQQLLELNRL